MRISDWSSDVCSSDLVRRLAVAGWRYQAAGADRLAGAIARDRVQAPGVLRVALFLDRNVLLHHEHRFAHGEQFVAGFGERDRFHPERAVPLRDDSDDPPSGSTRVEWRPSRNT